MNQSKESMLSVSLLLGTCLMGNGACGSEDESAAGHPEQKIVGAAGWGSGKDIPAMGANTKDAGSTVDTERAVEPDAGSKDGHSGSRDGEVPAEASGIGGMSCGDEDVFEWRDAILYFAMTDRFANGDPTNDEPIQEVDNNDPRSGPSANYAGGDFKGLLNKLAYITDLGATAIWLSPPSQNRDLAGDGRDLKAGDPHFYSGYHGYWVSHEAIEYGADPSDPKPDIMPQVEPRFGNAEDLKNLVNGAHSRGMKVLADYVMNHTDLQSRLYQAHPDWFVKEQGRFVLCGGDRLCSNDGSAQPCWDDPVWGIRCAFTQYLPPFDFGTHHQPRQVTQDWSAADAIWWAKEFDFDGYRLDAIKHVPLSWLTNFRRHLTKAVHDMRIKGHNGRFYLVGETFDYGSPSKLRDFIDPETMLDGQFDFPQRARLCKTIMRNKDEATAPDDAWLTSFAGSFAAYEQFLTKKIYIEWNADGTPKEASAIQQGNEAFYGPSALMAAWINNHDVPRIIHVANRDRMANGNVATCYDGAVLGWRRGLPENAWYNGAITAGQPVTEAPYKLLALAFAVLLTNPGVPLIYYGDEIGLAGGGDPDNRRMMPFRDGSGMGTGEDALELKGHAAQFQLALRQTVRALAHFRNSHKVLSRGQRTTHEVKDDTWVYTMGGCGSLSPFDEVTVAINRASKSRVVSFPEGLYSDYLSKRTIQGGKQTLPAFGMMLLTRQAGTL